MGTRDQTSEGGAPGTSWYVSGARARPRVPAVVANSSRGWWFEAGRAPRLRTREVRSARFELRADRHRRLSFTTTAAVHHHLACTRTPCWRLWCMYSTLVVFHAPAAATCPTSTAPRTAPHSELDTRTCWNGIRLRARHVPSRLGWTWGASVRVDWCEDADTLSPPLDPSTYHVPFAHRDYSHPFGRPEHESHAMTSATNAGFMCVART